MPEINLIVAVILGLMCLFLGFGVFWGLIRGLKKSSIRLVLVIIAALIAFFVTPLITAPVYESVKNIEFNGFTLAGIADLLPEDVNIDTSIIQALPIAVLNLLVFFVMFFALKMITWIIFAVIAHNAYRQREDGSMPKKRRLLGALIGLVQGVIVFAMVSMPIVGTVNVVNNTSTELKKYNVNIAEMAESFGVDGIDSVMSQIEDYKKYVDPKEYEGSIPNLVLKYTGMNIIIDAMYQKLTTVEIDGKQVAVSKVIPELIEPIFGMLDTVNKLMADLGISLDEVIEGNFDSFDLNDEKTADAVREILDYASKTPEVANLVLDVAKKAVEKIELPEGVSLNLDIEDSSKFLENIGEIGISVATSDVVKTISDSQSYEDVKAALDDISTQTIQNLAESGFSVTLSEEKYQELLGSTGDYLPEEGEDALADALRKLITNFNE